MPMPSGKQQAAAVDLMNSGAFPETIDLDERRAGVIAYIDRLDPQGRQMVVEDVAFDYERMSCETCDDAGGRTTSTQAPSNQVGSGDPERRSAEQGILD